MNTIEIPISELYPYESSALSSSVAYHRKLLQKGATLDPVEVVRVEGCLIVTNGTNRVYASKLEGRANILTFEGNPDILKIDVCRRTLKIRKANEQEGFENFPQDPDLAARAKRTNDERNEMGLLL